jgi:TolB-like protein
MARVFLSYAHEDAAKAKSLAGLLERGGHRVWWDPHLGGGALFAAEIAAALRDCEIVLVLWSRNSVVSTWVLDEAAEGRDSGRLIPILLDGIIPPLGFRQFQAVDLSRWSGRGRVPNRNSIDAAIATILNGGTLALAAEQPIAHQAPTQGRIAKTAAALIAVLLIAIAALYATGRLTPQTEAASVAVLPFSDLSAMHDKAYFAEGVSDEIRTRLASVPGVRVIGRVSIGMLGPKAGLNDVRKRLGVTHVLDGSIGFQGQKMRLDVRLLRTSDGVQIWADRYDRDLEDIFKVQSEIGSAVAAKLRARLWRYPLTERTAPTSFEVYDLVLASGAKMFEATYEASLEANRLAEQATRLDPSYAPAWVTRSRSIHAIDQAKPEGMWGPEWPARREQALRYARRAVELDPKDGDAQAFLGWAESDGEQPELALPRIEKAMNLNPGKSSVWGIAGIVYRQMCDRRRELQAMRRWFQLEPLAPAQDDMVLFLYALDRDAEAEAWRQKLTQPETIEALEVKMAYDRGDVSSAVATELARNPHGPSHTVGYALLALGQTDRAIEMLPSGYRDILGAYWHGDYGKAASQFAFINTTMWSNMRTWAIERSMVHAGRDRELLSIFEQRFGSVAEFDRRLRCNVASHAAPIVISLRRAGRNVEAQQLMRMAERRYAQSLTARDNEPSQHVGHIELLIVAGRLDDALESLERLLGIRGSRGAGSPLLFLNLDDPIFNWIRSDRRFQAVERRVADWRTREQRELAFALSKQSSLATASSH